MESRTHPIETGELWRLTMEHSPLGMCLVSAAGEFLSVNSALCDMLGHEPAALMSMTVRDVVHPDDLHADRRLSQDALDGAIDTFRIHERYLRADGSVMPGELTLSMVRDEAGDPLHFVCQIVDLSERRAFEARLESVEGQVDIEQRRVRAVFDAVDVGLLLIDAEGRYQINNACHQELLDLAFPAGHSGRAGEGGLVYDQQELQLLAREDNPAIRAAAGEEFSNVLLWVGDDPASRRAVSVSARSVRDRTGDFAGAALACHDVTELMRAIEVRDHFLASVSHELRTPLTSALAYLELLDGAEGLDAAARTQVDAVRRSALRLSHLVADLIFTATATSGVRVIDPFRVDLSMVVAEAVHAARLAAEEAGVRLDLQAPETLPVLADGLRMRQVADNLIANAITYTPPGGLVHVTLSATDRSVELVVADSGEGIEAADLDDIFSSFVKGQNARHRLSPGAGLGLAIVRTIVDAHGGEVSVQSAPGEGTSVHVVMPR